MRGLQNRLNTISRLIKKYKNMARAANQQRQWKKERNYIAELKALIAKREQLRDEMVQGRAAGGRVDPRVIKKINLLLNEMARDKRILGIHQANNNVPGIRKYEAIVQRQQQQLARLQNRPAAPAHPPANNNRRIRVLLNELKRDKQILQRHQQSNNAAGVAKYQQIVKSKLAELARLRGTNQGPGGSGSEGSGSVGQPTPPQTGGGTQQGTTTSASADEQTIANNYRQSRNIERAYTDLINALVDSSQFSNLKAAKDQLFDLNGHTMPPPAGSTINQPFIRDCFKIRTSNISLDGYTVIDGIFDTPFPATFDQKAARINALIGNALPHLEPYKKLAHRDAFQLIPQDRNISRSWSQFAGAKMQNVSLKNIRVQSQGSLQGVFSSDGAYDNLRLKNISVTTQSAHQIAILGLLSGTLELSNTDGSTVEVNLLPLRLGGGTNIYIIGFSAGSSYQYGHVESGSSNATIHDNRRLKTKRGTYYTNFDMDTFISKIQASPQSNLQGFLDLIKQSAALSGDLVAN